MGNQRGHDLHYFHTYKSYPFLDCCSAATLHYWYTGNAQFKGHLSHLKTSLAGTNVAEPTLTHRPAQMRRKSSTWGAA